MEMDLRKPLIVLLILFGLGYYVRTHYTSQDLLSYAKKHPDPTFSPMVEYYVGMGHFARSEYEPANRAFQQLLTDYPTCQYAEPGLLRLGITYEELRDWDGAREAYRQYLEQFPDGKNKRLVQNKYDQLRNR